MIKNIEKGVHDIVSNIGLIALSDGSREGRETILNILDYNKIRYNNGGKRIVVDSNQNDVVYKIIYSTTGLSDNMFEIINSRILLDLAQGGVITNDDLLLFALAYRANNHPITTIVQEKVIRIDECQEFRDFLTSERQRGVTESTQNVKIMWLSTVDSLRNSYNRIIEILTTNFVDSDTDIYKEPENYGIRVINGQLRVALLDMGSMVPKVVNRKGEIKEPSFCTCGSDMLRRTATLIGGITYEHIAKLFAYDVTYGCVDSTCGRNYLSLKDEDIKSRTEYNDSVIFNKYVVDNRDSINYLKATICKYYQPTRAAYSFSEYYASLTQAFPYDYSTQTISSIDIVHMYNIYTYEKMSNLIADYPGIVEELLGDSGIYYDGNTASFSTFGRRVDELITRMGFVNLEDEAYSKLIAYYYILKLTARITEPVSVIDIINTEKYADFYNMCVGIGMTDLDISEISNVLRII